MTSLHKYLRDFLGESEVKFAKIFNGQKISLTDFVIVRKLIYQNTVQPEVRDVCIII
jgi:hypothetical protein